ncbi:MAG: hypothetical protein BRC41_00995 [Cyanobacteria bacterium QH_9_48_43]|jgi:predicted  nucleic acid-binding Zn-ribbon protein|nr:MAG: hypothetical protein BRC36_00750 [Cyanobacteria bacterium QH_2_48_84]PSO72637.1 MAG: hypothetical protein BRC37_11210 [Cyanobacteria bacterium QH_3_48_40]PSO73379.1 MAG: hypothetical protein BRC42_04365 [Cyanobacteria bacterium QS_1_48_34]PSO89709.1 MAG: hypothetical protein BRC41_00995 [Cyanobacteria bacterium QH_9_48_43]PSP10823.1 MAG: hypothetical protein BRC50_13570 [Cyanobacteria bacterium SW_11_48_12]PSP14077.1 MAG: hypothetical protein BRC49_00510 [Cyanobacteria bacterium SW_10_
MTNSNGSDDRLDRIEKALEELKEGHNEIKKRLDTLDSRLFELILRSMSANSSAFFGVGIAAVERCYCFCCCCCISREILKTKSQSRK